MTTRDAAIRLRALMAVLSLWDLGIGVYTTLFASHVELWLRLEPQREPLFIRGVGVAWLFVAYVQLLGARDLEKNVQAVQLSLVFRLAEAAICAAEALFLLGRPAYFLHFLLALYAAVIGGPNLVAVDWVAASKMGVDPEISRYMTLAVERFGKPAIRLIGDASVYRPWLNVEAMLTWFTSKAVDGNYYFGNLFYMGCAHMDPAFPLREMPFPILALRKLTSPLRRAVFTQVGEDPTLLNRMLNRLFYKLGF